MWAHITIECTEWPHYGATSSMHLHHHLLWHSLLLSHTCRKRRPKHLNAISITRSTHPASVSPQFPSHIPFATPCVYTPKGVGFRFVRKVHAQINTQRVQRSAVMAAKAQSTKGLHIKPKQNFNFNEYARGEDPCSLPLPLSVSDRAQMLQKYAEIAY